MRHPYFDLYLHDDAALAAVLGSAIIARTTLSEWPLSCVQRVRTADGRTAIYKAQAEPSVEPQFYAAARSPALVAAAALPNPQGPAGLLLTDVATPRLSDGAVAPAKAPGVVGSVLEAIAGIEGELPALADLGSPEGYDRVIQPLLTNLTSLVETGTFQRVTADTVVAVANASASPSVLDALAGAVGYVHGDLRADNVFADAGGSVQAVIDWQRPLYGPVALDQATLLESLGFDPLPLVGPGVLALLALTRIAWLAACACRWFPPGVATYDAQIAALAAGLPGAVGLVA